MPEDLEPQAHWIHGIGIGGYRSFGDVQRIGPFRKINLIIGQNNSGKSNLLRLLANHYEGLCRAVGAEEAPVGLTDLDRHRGSKGAEFNLWLTLPLEGPAWKNWQQSVRGQLHEGRSAVSQTAVKRLVESEPLSGPGPVAWFRYKGPVDGKLTISDDLVAQLSEASVFDTIIEPAKTLSEQSRRPWVVSALSLANPAKLPPPEVVLVPAIREILPSKEERSDAKSWEPSGLGLIQGLAKLQNPGYAEQNLKKKFEGINAFVRSVTASKAATLEIPADRDTILVHMNERTLPLESLGTGIHEVVIIAATATVLSKKVICIEEPEIHLHPILQRKLVRYLEEQTDNQYFFATHSAHLLQHPNAAIFHVRLEDGQSIVRSVDSPEAKSEVCIDLGYRASDIIQADCVIWVEGPSDRLYLRHWIHAEAPELVEGIDYSIMFYGGRLLNQLSAKDPEVEDFISLRRLNRFIAVLIDSDRTKPKERLNKTKQRVRREFDEGRGFAWVTKGREIENYVPDTLLEQAIHEAHPSAHKVPPFGQYQRLPCYKTKNARKWKPADKIKVARRVVQDPADLDQLDLQKQIRKMVAFIREANEV